MKAVELFKKRAFISSLLLHILLATALLWQNFSIPLPLSATSRQVTETEESVMQAVTLDQNQVEKQIQMIQREKKIQIREELAHQRALRQQSELAEKKVKEALKKIDTLKETESSLKKMHQKQAEQAAEKLLAFKQKLHDVKKEADQLKEKNVAEQKKLAEIKKAEAALTAKKKADAIALKKKQSELAQKQKSLLTVQQSALLHYQSLIVEEIGHHWRVPHGVDKKLSCKLQIELGTDGKVLTVQVVHSSGDPLLDRSAQTAVFNASPLPVPDTPELFAKFKLFYLTVRPENIISS